MTAANVWLIVAIVSFVLSGLSLIASIVIFIKFKILNVVADLSGKTVARGIKEMQDETAASNSKKGRFSLDREDVTGKMSAKNIDKNAMALAHESKRLDKTTSNLKKRGSKTSGLTDKFSTGDLNTPNSTAVMTPGNTEVMPGNQRNTEVMSAYNKVAPTENGTAILGVNATSVLTQNNGTAVLGSDSAEVFNNGTAVLGNNGTAVLNGGETSVLNGTTVLGSTSVEPISTPVVSFTVTRTILEIHTDEVI